ncbi:hypothetical protein K435DRAFT_804256 [Dendrothele bispora CBS 962.96]|uniref:Uncharacterized protein n=1 Tax=Dendrothele bispora (strain CBS 962.96) TaxID=1314807 RepID=A0A4S8LF03_DENBC|nr:hypothetical protein K435DRAFT_804256 [Dendrothele bispora CBS 962.96]
MYQDNWCLLPQLTVPLEFPLQDLVSMSAELVFTSTDCVSGIPTAELPLEFPLQDDVNVPVKFMFSSSTDNAPGIPTPACNAPGFPTAEMPLEFPLQNLVSVSAELVFSASTDNAPGIPAAAMPLELPLQNVSVSAELVFSVSTDSAPGISTAVLSLEFPLQEKVGVSKLHGSGNLLPQSFSFLGTVLISTAMSFWNMETSPSFPKAFEIAFNDYVEHTKDQVEKVLQDLPDPDDNWVGYKRELSDIILAHVKNSKGRKLLEM